MRIVNFQCEHKMDNCITDNANPVFSYAIESDDCDVYIEKASLTIGDECFDARNQLAVRYEGAGLKPFGRYEARLSVWDNKGNKAEAKCLFGTGRLGSPWQAKWITDGSYSFKEKGVSPEIMCFSKHIQVEKKIKTAILYSTAIGIYEAEINGQKVSDTYFAPGFTSYKNRLMYQTYDVTGLLNASDNRFLVYLAGGWAVGSFVFTRKNRITADRQALLMELRIEYEDGSLDIVGTDETWDVSRKGRYKLADLYDGETYDATVDEDKLDYHKAAVEKLKISPQITAQCGAPTIAHERFTPVSMHEYHGGTVFDFGQNLAGIVELRIHRASQRQEIVVKHAEILKQDGGLNTDFLRSAKAEIHYICREGEQIYSPTFTYMGYRYVWVSGIKPEDFDITSIALYADMEQTGSFSCSNEAINKLQNNIIWSAKSNMVEIPTDCPQRDERMGWTGDIAVFAPTACYNFDMTRFLTSWLADVRAEQNKTGGLPNTVPAQGYGFPATMPAIAIEFWGDASVLVPWALYQAKGDIRLLSDNYDMMKKYVDACKRWAGLFSFGGHRYLWNTPSVLHFGDWVAADVPKMSEWQKRTKWTATASLCNTSMLLAKTARIIGREADAEKYQKISEGAALAYNSLLTDGQGRLKKEFQTAYVLPIYFNIFEGQAKKNAVERLAELVEKNNYCIGTGFPGTPYILFALADNGRADVALKMLLNDKCPSWLHEVKMGATTIWERWDGLNEDGVCPIGDDGTDMMISYNHYASGAVGDFLYRRIAGIEAIESGYRKFKIKPLVSEEINAAQGEVDTPFGKAGSDWKLSGDEFQIKVKVPVGCECQLHMPDGSVEVLGSGTYERKCMVGQ